MQQCFNVFSIIQTVKRSLPIIISSIEDGLIKPRMIGTWSRSLKFFRQLPLSKASNSKNSQDITLVTQELKIPQLCYISAMLWVRANPRPLRPINMGGPQEAKWPRIYSNSKHKEVLIVWWWWWVGPHNRVMENPGNGPSFGLKYSCFKLVIC